MPEEERDRPEIESIVKDYLGLVYSFVFRLTGDANETSDLTQEVFIKVWKNLSKYQPSLSLRPWILTIARHTAIDWLRKKKSVPFSRLDREGEDGPISFEETLADEADLQDEIFAHEEVKENLAELLKKLPIPQQEVFILRLEDDLSFEEIAQVTGRPMNTVKSQYRRSLLSLRRYLDPNSDFAPKGGLLS